MNRDDFLKHEKASRDTIDVKRVYITMAGDIAAGVLFSQIMYWHLPSDDAPTRLTVKHKGQMWLAKKRNDWWDECCMLPKQFDRAIKTLEQRKMVKTELFRYGGSPTKHTRINWDTFLEVYNAIISNDKPSFDSEGGKWIFPNRENGNSPTGNIELPEQGISESPVDPTPDAVIITDPEDGTKLAFSESTNKESSITRGVSSETITGDNPGKDDDEVKVENRPTRPSGLSKNAGNDTTEEYDTEYFDTLDSMLLDLGLNIPLTGGANFRAAADVYEAGVPIKFATDVIETLPRNKNGSPVDGNGRKIYRFEYIKTTILNKWNEEQEVARHQSGLERLIQSTGVYANGGENYEQSV